MKMHGHPVRSKDGVKTKKDDMLPKLLKRTSNISIIEYNNEFEKRLHKGKTSYSQMSDDVLVYHILKNADLKQSIEKLTKLQLLPIRYRLMKEQLKRYSVIYHHLLAIQCYLLLPGESVVKIEETETH